MFDQWIGDTAYVDNVDAANTTVTMPDLDVELTATYESIIVEYTLTVNGGSGGGSYEAAEVVGISADAPSTADFLFKG